MRLRYVVGCMSGTSMDAIDAALIAIEGRGLAMRVNVLHGASVSLRALRPLIAPLAAGKSGDAVAFTALALKLGQSHIAAIQLAIGRRKVDLIAVHGQTLYHAPPLSWQILNPHPIAQAFGVPVVFDLRGADLAAGGQGAPITPLADWVLLRHPSERRIVVNLGGFANYTDLPPGGRADIDHIRGGDLCVCNQLLDTIAARYLRKPFDRNGEAASKGRIIPVLYRRLCQQLQTQAAAGRSLGTGDEIVHCLPRPFAVSKGPDVAATACAAIGHTLSGALQAADRVILAGGGAFNRTLVAEISRHFPGSVNGADDLGVPIQYREAIEMAVLGALCADRVPITLRQVTHRNRGKLISGCWVHP